MVRGFTEEEKESIRALLMEEGKQLFARFGLKKTSIAELTKAAGISPSAFYNFFQSKEELYAAIFEEEENKLQESLMGKISQSDQDDFQKTLQSILMIGKEALTTNPFIVQLVLKGDITHLMRKLPKERIETHMLRDYDQFFPMLEHFQGEGKVIAKDRKVLVTVMQLFFLLHVHRKDFDPEVFDQATDLLAQWIARGMTSGNCEEEQD
ncbi:TetR/AcrR family transcriptional regulator [Virgibacillus oceani]